MEVKVCEHKLSVTENGQGTAPTAETLNQTNRPRQKNSSSSTVVSCWPCVHWKKTLEAVVLSCVILVVWGIFALPTIFYILPPLQVSIYIIAMLVYSIDYSSNELYLKTMIQNRSMLLCRVVLWELQSTAPSLYALVSIIYYNKISVCIDDIVLF